MQNITWHTHRVTKQERAQLKNQNPCVVWLTGLSGSGKSTFANALEQELVNRGFHTFLLDGDNLRCGLNRDLGFCEASRIENVRRVGEVAKLFVEAGLIVIVALIAPFKRDRDFARGLVCDNEFIEVFMDTPLSVCEERDVKGLYKKARRGEIENFTGISSAYEQPQNADITFKGSGVCVSDNVNLMLELLRQRKII